MSNDPALDRPAKSHWVVDIKFSDGTGMRTHRTSLDRAMQLVAEEHVRMPIKQATVLYQTVLNALIDP